MKALVVIARGLNLGSIGCYGNEWVQTPALDRLAAEGVVFDQHVADQPDAAGAQRAWQTGCYRFPSVKPEEDWIYQEPANLFALLAERGIATFLVHDEMSGIPTAAAAGWQQSYLLESAGEESALLEQVSAALTQALTRLAPYRQWLLRFDSSILLRPGKFTKEFLDSYPAACEEDEEEEDDQDTSISRDSSPGEFLAPEDLAFRHLQDRYAALVQCLDTLLGCLIQELERRGLVDEMLVLITSDHGQKLGENTARPGSRLSLHEELIHIPLILRLPGKAQAGRRVAALTQSIDVLPTLFHLFGERLPAVHGYSLLPLVNGETDRIRPYACAGLRNGDAVEWALRSPEWAFLLPGSISSSETPTESELYVKPEDRWEVNNVRQHHLEFAERLEQTLRGFVAATCCPGPLQPPELPQPGQEPALEEQVRTTDSPERNVPI